MLDCPRIYKEIADFGIQCGLVIKTHPVTPWCDGVSCSAIAELNDFVICSGTSTKRNLKMSTSQNQQYSAALFVFLCIEYIIFDACGLFVKKNSGSFSAALRV
jgi:hypothetical protein